MKSKQQKQSSLSLGMRNQILNETVRGEMRHFHKNRTTLYQLNPSQIHLFTEKPTQRDQSQTQSMVEQRMRESAFDDDILEAFSNQQLHDTVLKSKLQPQQKYRFPQTSSQDYGWYVNNLNQEKPTYDFKSRKCDCTAFADKYFQTNKINPFKIRGR